MMTRLRLVPALVATCVIAVGGATAGPQAQAQPAADGVIQDFESDTDLGGITVSVPGADRIDRAPYPTHGESSVRFTVAPASTPGSSGSAGLTMRAGTAGLPVTDWSGHAAVGWDFFTDNSADTVGRITIRDSRNKSWGADYPVRHRGWTPFNVRLGTLTAAGLDVTSIGLVSVSIPRAAQPVTGYYDAFRLVDEYPYDQSAYGDRAAVSLLSLCRYAEVLAGLDRTLSKLAEGVENRPDPADQRLAAEVRSVREEVAALRAIAGGPAPDAEAYAGLNTRTTAAERRVPRLANTIGARRAAPRSGFGVDSADSMALVYPKDLPYASTGTRPTLSLARGESESLQAVVLPYAEPLGNVTAKVASVRGPGGAGDLEVAIDPVGSLNTTPSSAYHRPAYSGWTPDPIRDDLTSVDVAAADVQPYWVRVRAGATAEPGTYTIQLAFDADGKPASTLTVQVKVWPFAIPDEPKLTTAFQFTPWIVYELYHATDPAARDELRHRFWAFLDDYKVQPDQIYTVEKTADGKYVQTPPSVEDVLYIKEHFGLDRFNVLFLNRALLDPAHPETWQAQIDRWLDQIGTAMAAYEAAGVADRAYVYGFDEATGPMLTAAKQTFTAIRQRFPELPIATTLRDNSMGVDTGLAGLVDWWIPQQNLYDQAVAERTRARGDQAWWYPDIATGFPYPNWFNGFPPVDGRMLMGPMSYQAGVEGVLYYAANRWVPADHAAQPLVDDGIFSQWNPVTFGTTAGDGSVFYPGPDGPMASIRLENIRDGMEDYNLLWVLKQRLDANPGAPSDVRQRAEAALSARAVVTGARTFTEDPVAYRAWRDQAAKALLDLG
ncbi:DUF4091 domain-containing protein [Flindersiella endophytica]